MLSENKILYLARKDGNSHSKAYVKRGKLEKKGQLSFAVKDSATREKRKGNILLIYVEKIKKENANAPVAYILFSTWYLRKLNKTPTF